MTGELGERPNGGRYAHPARALPVVGSLAFTTLFFLAWPTQRILDDGAIALRYMDHFAQGLFFTYNPSDGPVFGLSSFIHGLLAGALAYSHVLSPLGSLFASNFIGLVLVGLMTAGIVRHFLSDPFLQVPVWLFLMVSPHLFLLSAKQGLETPLHAGLILAAFLCFLSRRLGPLWLMSSLAVISKLDALPVVGVIGLAALLGERRRWKTASFWRTELRRFGLWGALPLALWIALSSWALGGPVPQSARAKLLYHRSTEGSWIDTVGPLFEGSRGALLGLSFGLAFVLAWMRRADPVLRRSTVFGVAALAYLAVLATSRPLETHLWYYAVPQLLLHLQVGLVFARIAETRLRTPRSQALVAAGLVVAFAGAAWITVKSCREMARFLDEVESQRMDIGRWLKEESRSGDTLFSGHGHIARESGLYTIDYSGINSAVALELGLDHDRMIHELKPTWIVYLGVLDARLQSRYGYALHRSWYTPAQRGGVSWRVYQRTPDGAAAAFVLPLSALEATDGRLKTTTTGIVASGVTQATLPGPPPTVRCAGLAFGVDRAAPPLSVEATAASPDGTPDQKTLLRRGAPTPVAGYGTTEEWRVPFDPTAEAPASVEIVLERRGELLEPIYLDCVRLAPGGAATASLRE